MASERNKLFEECVEYMVEIRLVTAHGQSAPSADAFERIVQDAIKQKFNVPTTPYYCSSVTVTERKPLTL